MIHTRLYYSWSNQDYSQNYPQDMSFHHLGTERTDELKKCHQKKEDQKNGWEKKDTYKKEKMDGLDKLTFIFPGIYICMKWYLHLVNI